MMDDAPSRPAGSFGYAVLLAAIVFAAVAPTLTWQQFSGGSENLNAATVQEMHRGGPWLVPYLNNHPRLAKPPLTAWISASLVSRRDIENLNATDQALRDAAYNTFAFKLRWPALLAGCGILLATYAMGRALDGPRFGLIAAVVCASSLIFLRFARSSTTDINLALFVSIANAAFASMLFGRATIWRSALLGLALGLAFMSKGPVGLVQTVLPWIVFVLIDPETRASIPRAFPRVSLHGIIATAVTLLIGLPWYIYVLTRFPNAIALWRAEVTREGATTLAPDPWYLYVNFIPLMLPWSGFFIAGILMILRQKGVRPLSVASEVRAGAFTLCLLIVPVLVMSFARDKNDRYLLPMLSAASVVIAIAVKPQLKPREQQNAADRALRIIQLILLAVIAIGLPIAGASGWIRDAVQKPWFSWTFAAYVVVPMTMMLALLAWMSTRKPWVIVPSSLIIMLLVQFVFMEGYSRDKSGRSEVKEVADAIMTFSPRAKVWYYDPRTEYKQMPQDLNIYLNRLIVDAREGDFAHAAAGDIAVMLQREKEDSPTIAGWRPIASAPWGRRFWWAFVRE